MSEPSRSGRDKCEVYEATASIQKDLSKAARPPYKGFMLERPC